MDLSPESIELLSLETIGSHPACPVNYIYAPKNACSSLKATMLGQDGHPHASFQEAFCTRAIDIQKPFICVTRNPFDRILSAYGDKIASTRGTDIEWFDFCSRYSVDRSSELSFSEFLFILCADKAPHRLDVHFRPQVYVHNHAFLRPRFVGRVEAMQDVKDYLLQHGLAWKQFENHYTDARAKRSSLTPHDLLAISHLYKLDFETYGYEVDHTSDFVPPSILQEQDVSRELKIAAGLRGRLSPEEFVLIRRLLLGSPVGGT